MAVANASYPADLGTISMPSSALGSPLAVSFACFLTPGQSPPTLRPLSMKSSRFLALASSNPPPLPAISDQAVLDAVSKMDDSENTLPAIRVFENDLARLTLVGAVDFQQAVTAAAADGGEAAEEHLFAGMEAMVVETVFPGSADDHSTVSTRLFLPAWKVKEKAGKLKKSLTKDILNGTSSRNILAMTFRQVVMERLWSLELEIFSPGTERNMNDLGNSREVSIVLMLSTSDERLLSEIAEVVCNYALETTKSRDLQESMFRKLNGFLLTWFNKHKGIFSNGSSVCLHGFLENEILASADALLEKFNLERGSIQFQGSKWNDIWWSSPAFSALERFGGPEFCSWISQCVPSYMLGIDDKNFNDLKLGGWNKSVGSRWEAFLVHSQMACLADVLDMYYEDVFTLPNKKLSCHAVAKSSSKALSKGNFLLNAFSSVTVAAIFMVSVNVLKKIYLPHLPMKTSYVQKNSEKPVVSSATLCSVTSSQLEEYCMRIISRIKDHYGWPGEAQSHPQGVAWIGELPAFLRTMDDTMINIVSPSSKSTPVVEGDEERKGLESILTYQVVLSGDGTVIGFQPTNRAAVNNWAANPLAKDLYRGKHLSPGFLEPRLKLARPNGVVVLELLMSMNPNSYSALVRSVDISRE